MKDDFGYFGSGLEGYVQYNDAFNRNFETTSPNSANTDDNDAGKENALGFLSSEAPDTEDQSDLDSYSIQ